MRRKERQIVDKLKIDKIIRSCQVCRIAFADLDEPYIVPVSFGYDGESIFFHTALTGRKINFIEYNPKVCFEFDHNVQLVTHPEDACEWTATYESVIGYGIVKELVDTKEKLYGLNRIMYHYSGKEWDFKTSVLKRTRVWSINIKSITGKQSSQKRT